MSRRIFAFSAAIVVLLTVAVVNLFVLDIVTLPESKEMLKRSVLVVATSTMALVVISALVRIGHRPTDRKPHTDR